MRARLLLPRVGEERDDARDSILHHSRRAFGLVLPRVHDRSDKTHSQNGGPSGCGRSCVVQTDNMPKKMLIDATHAEETRVVVVDGNKVEEFDFETENRRQIAGNIYLAKVTRVEPSLQAAFVDYGGNRHGFLAFSEIHPDYYQIPVADREALMEEERAYAEAQKAREKKMINQRNHAVPGRVHAPALLRFLAMMQLSQPKLRQLRLTAWKPST